MAVLVTGGAGFIGSHVMERLVAGGSEVICLDNFDDFYSPAIKRANIRPLVERGHVRLYEGDILDRDFCLRIFRNHRIEAIIHLAARPGVRASLANPRLYQQLNCGGTLSLLELARDFEVGKFVFGSSSSVYGDRSEVPFHEEDGACHPVSPYAASKRAAELFCYNFHHLYGLPVVCLRLFTVYGPRQRPEMAIHKFTRLVDQGQPIKMFGDGSSERDYTYIADIVEGILRAQEAKLDFETINLGGSHPYRLDYLVRLIEKNLGRKAQVRHLPEQPGDVRVTYADVTKAGKVLGYKPTVSLEEGIASFVHWYRQRGRSNDLA